MIRHIAVFTWRPEATDEQKQRIAAELAALPGLIPEVRGYRFGPDQGLAPGNADYAVVADFDDTDGYFAYRDHPAHRKILVDMVRPILASRMAAQIEI